MCLCASKCSERESIVAELILACKLPQCECAVCVADKLERQVARQEAGLLLAEDRTGDAELQGFDNYYWAPEVIKLSRHFDI